MKSFSAFALDRAFRRARLSELQEWQLSTELLRHVRQAMELKPVRLLDLDALAEANFEWILAEREGRIRSTEWCLRHDRSLGQLPALDATSFEHLTARRPSKTLEEGMKLSRGVLRACLHLASSSPRVELAVQALLPLVEAVPRMLARDLTLPWCLLPQPRLTLVPPHRVISMLNPLEATARIAENYRRYLLTTFRPRNDRWRREFRDRLRAIFHSTRGRIWKRRHRFKPVCRSPS